MDPNLMHRAWQLYTFVTVTFWYIMISTITASDNFQYISNDNIKLGIDLTRGASIGYLSSSTNSINIINDHDMGREIQQSYYAGPTPYDNCTFLNNEWPWNPIGAGDINGNSGKILQIETPTPTSLHTEMQPLQWACDNVACNCTFEQYIKLNGQRIDVTAILHNHRIDKNDYGAYSQELPAVYTIGTLYQLWTYNGSKAWTNDSLVQLSTYPNTIPWTPGDFKATENWAAFVNDENWGLGIVNFNTQIINGGFFGTTDSGNSQSDNCGYLAPTMNVDLTYNITYVYNYSLVLGYLNDIRKIVYQLHSENDV